MPGLLQMLPFQLNIFPMKRHRPLPSFSSPRISHDDGTIPTDLKLHAERWSHMSRLAGAHQQDDTVLRIPRTNMAPRSLQSGIPPQLASRIAEVHLGSVTNLPEWLDVLSTHFTNVQHLHAPVLPVSSRFVRQGVHWVIQVLRENVPDP